MEESWIRSFAQRAFQQEVEDILKEEIEAAKERLNERLIELSAKVAQHITQNMQVKFEDNFDLGAKIVIEIHPPRLQ